MASAFDVSRFGGKAAGEVKVEELVCCESVKSECVDVEKRMKESVWGV